MQMWKMAAAAYGMALSSVTSVSAVLWGGQAGRGAGRRVIKARGGIQHRCRGGIRGVALREAGAGRTGEQRPQPLATAGHRRGRRAGTHS